jgi:hypothetical protein
MSGVQIPLNAQLKTIGLTLGTGATVIYQSAPKRNGVLVSFTAANLTASAQAITVIYNAGSDLAIWSQVSIPARQTVLFEGHPIILKDGALIKALAGAGASISFIAVVAEGVSQS